MHAKFIDAIALAAGLSVRIAAALPAFRERTGLVPALAVVPGGAGPMTIMTLMHNTILAACARERLPPPQL